VKSSVLGKNVSERANTILQVDDVMRSVIQTPTQGCRTPSRVQVTPSLVYRIMMYSQSGCASYQIRVNNKEPPLLLGEDSLLEFVRDLYRNENENQVYASAVLQTREE
jgi:hypothetical protein